MQTHSKAKYRISLDSMLPWMISPFEYFPSFFKKWSKSVHKMSTDAQHWKIQVKTQIFTLKGGENLKFNFEI